MRPLPGVEGPAMPMTAYGCVLFPDLPVPVSDHPVRLPWMITQFNISCLFNWRHVLVIRK